MEQGHDYTICKVITTEQNVRFLGGICPEKIQLDQIENGRHAAIFYFNMRNIWEYLSSMTMLKQIVMRMIFHFKRWLEADA